jgi:Fic family protein
VIYQYPALEDADISVLAMIDAQKERLRHFTSNAPRRWFGSLRRSTMARAIQGSNSIEGYHATLDDAMAAVENEPVSDERTETARAIKGYRDALTFIFQLAGDPHFEINGQLLKSLHFMMLGFDLTKYPGQWRPGSVYVVDSRSGETVYAAPGAEAVNLLIEELVSYLRNSAEPLVIKAAMAHLNLTLIHPFKDGNGRMARAVQTLVMTRGGALHPVFSSIEEWLGLHTQEYYGALTTTAEGKWSPARSARPWIRFCLKAHYQQAETLIRRNEEYELLYARIAAIAERLNLPERMNLPLFDAALGFRVTSQRHRSDADISEVSASRDLKKLSQIGLLTPFGEKRGRFYRAGEELTQARMETRVPRPLRDPYTSEQA